MSQPSATKTMSPAARARSIATAARKMAEAQALLDAAYRELQTRSFALSPDEQAQRRQLVDILTPLEAAIDAAS